MIPTTTAMAMMAAVERPLEDGPADALDDGLCAEEGLDEEVDVRVATLSKSPDFHLT